jgi:hypothetical protein
MKMRAGFNELVDKALDDALADLKSADIRENSPGAVVAREESGRAVGAEIARKKSRKMASAGIVDREGERVASAEITRQDSARTRRASRCLAADDSQRALIPAALSGIVDHNSALLAVAGAAVSADCDPCLDAVVPELKGIGMSKDDIRAAVESGRFPGAFPHLTAEVFERACAVASEDELDCIGE